MKYKTSKDELDRMIEEATVDCKDDDEVFMGILCTLTDNLSFPFQAKALGDNVEVIDIDGDKSGVGRGITVNIKKNGRVHKIGLADLKLKTDDAKNLKLIEMYNYWLENYCY